MATTLTPTDFGTDASKVTGTVELGPRSMALLRRMVKALEIIADQDVPDPGKPSETDESISDQQYYLNTP